MNWEAIGASAELLAAVGVIATLIYLAIQIRQNTRALRTASFQSATDALNQVNLTTASDEKLAEAFELSLVGGFNDLDPVTKRRHYFMILSVLRVFESAYYQQNNGLLEQASWQRYEHSLNLLLNAEGTIEFWRQQGFGFTEEFAKYVEMRIKEITGHEEDGDA